MFKPCFLIFSMLFLCSFDGITQVPDLGKSIINSHSPQSCIISTDHGDNKPLSIKTEYYSQTGKITKCVYVINDTTTAEDLYLYVHDTLQKATTTIIFSENDHRLISTEYFKYNSKGELIEDDESSQINYKYNVDGTLKERTSKTKDGKTLKIIYSYDSLGRQTMGKGYLKNQLAKKILYYYNNKDLISKKRVIQYKNARLQYEYEFLYFYENRLVTKEISRRIPFSKKYKQIPVSTSYYKYTFY